jgi:hypothetical protein
MRWAIALVVAALLVAGLFMVLGPVVSAAVSPRGPEQPIAFAHSVHVAVDQIDCVFCHRGVTRGPAATLPAVEQCMFCHQVVTPGDSLQAQEVEKIRTAWRTGQPITWQRVHRAPDHALHARAHIRGLSQRRGITIPPNLCDLPRRRDAEHRPNGQRRWRLRAARQMRTLNMGDCVNCRGRMAPNRLCLLYY